MNSQWTIFFNGKNLETAPESYWTGIPCQTLKNGSKKSWQELKNKVLKSRVKYANSDPSEFIECNICGYCGREIAIHVKTHGIDPRNYGVTKCQEIRNKIRERVKGDKNPGYKHGGKLSPYSKKFIRYENGTANYTIEDVLKKQKQSYKENPQNRSNTLEFYLSRGLNVEEAKAALHKRQSTFSKEKCIKKYGEVEGVKIWQSRQDKWQNTLNSKPPEEIADINRRKCSSFNFRWRWKNLGAETPGIFYIIEMPGRGIKVGITTKGLQGRYGDHIKKCNIILTREDTIGKCFMLEFLIKNALELKPFRYLGSKKFEGWTETFTCPKENILECYNNLKENFVEIFKEKYPQHFKGQL